MKPYVCQTLHHFMLIGGYYRFGNQSLFYGQRWRPEPSDHQGPYMANFFHDYLASFHHFCLPSRMDSPQPHHKFLETAMKILKLLCLISASSLVYADTIGQYMTVANNITRMEMKADAEAQAWVRSARNVLLLTSESIWESLSIANDNANHHLFCVSDTNRMSAETMTDLIKDSYQQLNMPEAEKNQFTVAKIALLGLQKKYPCGPQASSQISVQHHGESPIKKMAHIGKMAGLL
jgi:hypothetical protein